jgi:hypothetical protein
MADGRTACDDDVFPRYDKTTINAPRNANGRAFSAREISGNGHHIGE